MKKNGYTLIELLAVIVILGVVGGAAIFSYTQYSKHARDKAYENLEETLFDCKSRYFSGKMYYFFYKKNIWNLDFV